MAEYKAPLRDIQFLFNDVLDMNAHYQNITAYQETATLDMVEAILQEGARFCENELAPLSASGDQEGCRWSEEGVKTPSGFKEAYQKFVENGWPSLPHEPDRGGQGLPESLGIVMSELIGTANWSWGMYPGLSHGAMNTLEMHGTTEQKDTYLTKLISGEWTGTMCLTEAHCGSDLGTLKSKATPNEDGSYRISGTKIFISAGEHDMTENIVHIVLARLPDAPQGTKGISLFIVPKFLPNDQGGVGERNGVHCGSIEHKMGIHGNSTAVLNFDDAKAFLIGQPNKGLNHMFTFMNTARIGTALQGIAASERALQGALAYAKDRLAMRSLSGAKCPDKEADPIIVHPDVRRMLFTMKAFAEGGRALVYLAAKHADLVKKGDTEEIRKEADEMLAFLTPIAKAFLTEVGFEAANLGIQVLGGHGYIQEWGMEQNVRDTRIATIYEGTTGIQALDLLGRKVLMTQGESLKRFTKIVHKFCQFHQENEAMQPFVKPLAALNKEWGEHTMKIGMAAMKNRDEVGAAAYDYLMYSGYIVLGYLFAQQAQVSQAKLSESVEDPAFYHAKIKTAHFYFERILPRSKAHADAMLSGCDALLSLPEDDFWL